MTNERPDLIPVRAHVLDALMALKEAHAALCEGDPRTAQIKLDVTAANVAEARKLLPAAIAPTVG